MTFVSDITRFIERTGIRGELVFRKAALDTYADILRRSPVDEGRYRDSHRVSVNRVDLSVAAEGPSGGPAAGSPMTGAEVARALDALSEFKLGDTIHLSNNLPYAEPIENGHSGQAPQGVYRLAFEALVERFDQLARSV